MSEALPCPHCGGTEIHFNDHGPIGRGLEHRGDHVWSMCCYKCGATFPNMYNKEGLLKAWNRRVPPDPDTVTRLRLVLKMLGLENAVPSDDTELMESLFTVLGQIRFQIERTAEQEAAQKRLKGIQQMCGYVENGSHTTVKISQDDATRDWTMTVGKTNYHASTFGRMVDMAMLDNPPESYE